MVRPAHGATTYVRLLRAGDRFYWREHTFTVTGEPIKVRASQGGGVIVPLREIHAGRWFTTNARVRLKR